MNSLKDIIQEEDYMIKQLDLMEGELDRYLEFEKSDGGNIKTNDQIYAKATEITKIIDNVQKDIDEVEGKIMQNSRMNDDNLTSIGYENTIKKEQVNIDVIYFNLDK